MVSPYLARMFSRFSSPWRRSQTAKTAAYSLKATNTGSTYNNLGASGAVTFTLPALGSNNKGVHFTFQVVAAQTVTIDPGSGQAIHFRGAKKADDTNLVSNRIGDSITLEADNNKDWHVTSVQGHWGEKSDAAGWALAPVEAVLADPSIGYYWRDDFLSNVTTGINYTEFDDAGCTIAMLAGVEGGVLRLLTDTTDNDEINMALGDNVGTIMQPDAGAFWFEAKIRTDTIANTKLPFFVGLLETALIGDGVIADAGTMVDKDYIGFRRIEADGDKLDTVMNTESGGGEVEIQADAVTLVADTWKTVGMYSDGTTITFYDDGTALGTTTTLATAGCPNDQYMTIAIACKNAAAGAQSLDMDYWRFLQLR
jgi:hypothetical protein|tara:strand:- start:15123 stop:16226 length:1104 start_codon:yes stop_codon:yes gene_type:complete